MLNSRGLSARPLSVEAHPLALHVAAPAVHARRHPQGRPQQRECLSVSQAQQPHRRSVAMAAAGTPAERAAAAASDSTSVSATGLPRTAVVGVLGGGQLGRMMALAAANMGVKLKVLDPSPNAPAAIIADHVQGHFRDAADINAFAADCDVLTIEIEHVDADALEAFSVASGVGVQPTPSTLRIIQDKFLQKQFFEAAGVPGAAHCDVSCRADLELTGSRFGYPFMLKSKRLAYDGKGNFLVRSSAQLDAAAAALGGFDKGLYAEQFAPFVKELAVMVVRSLDGSVKSYPVVETVHRDNICHVTEAPADVPEATRRSAALIAEKAIGCLQGAGIFGVEMFLLPDGRLLLNEVAPRPHNSGHYTMDGCITSQFENHVRAVLGWPLGDTSLNCTSSVMLNVLGQTGGDAGVRAAHDLMGRAYGLAGAKVHWYGKEGMSKGRKVGHINISANSRAEGREKLAKLDPSAAAALQASTEKAAAVGLTAPPSASVQHSTGAVRQRTAQVGIIMGSDSDLATMKGAAQVLEEFGVPFELTVISAHRTPERMMEYAQTAHKRGLKAIIAGAGGAAHLPGMVAAMTPLPTIGVPVRPAGAYLDGMDALLSIVQMPKGVPVATVAIGNAANAGLLAVRIMAAYEPELLDKMVAYQAGMKETVLAKAVKLEASGWANYTMGPSH